MDLEKRIAELEAQVRSLSDQLRTLGHAAPGRESAGPLDSQTRGQAEGLPGELSPASLLEDVRRGVDRVLGGEPGDSLEDKIGGIWLSRFAAVLVMTGVAIAAVRTVETELLAHWQKVAIGYAGAIVALVYGFIAGRSKHDVFAHTILGTGLAGLYFTTYAAFFLEHVRVFDATALALPTLIVALMFLVGVVHWKRSQTAAGISLFLVYYTVVVSCTRDTSANSVIYAYFTCAVLCVVALVFHAAHRWLFFTWAAFIATYLTYIFFLWSKPVDFQLGDRDYFWLSNGFLALCYVLFSVACVIDAHRRGEFRKMVAPLAGVNSGTFFVLTYWSIREHYPEQEWMFRLGFAVILTLLCIFAETAGPRRNYLFQVFIAKAVIMYTLTLQSLLSGELLLLAMAIECLGLVFSYHRSGIVAFKVLNLALMLITLLGCLVYVRAGGVTDVFGYEVRRNWLCCAGVPVIFAVCAWFYEQFVRKVHPQNRTVSGQWFLADTALDVTNTAAAMMHASSAALILLAVTILDQGENVMLPYLLAGEAVVMALFGLVLRTPQVDAASVLLLVASHVTYYFFLWIGKPGFEDQLGYVPLTASVAVLTFFGAFLWERYLYRFEGGKPWEHDLVAAAPYLIGTVMLTTLFGRTLDWMYAPLAQNGAGILLLFIGCIIHYTGLKASGIVAITIGTYTYFARLYDVESPLTANAEYLPYLSILVCSYVAGEREFALLQRQERVPSRTENAVRTVLVMAAYGVAMIGTYELEDLNTLPLPVVWIGIAAIGMALGALFRESRYRWMAFVVVAFAIVRVYRYVQTGANVAYQLMIIGLILFVVSWAYSRYRRRRPRAARSPRSKEMPGNG